VLADATLASSRGPAVRHCPSCGAPVEEAASVCGYCQAPLAWSGTAPMAPRRSVKEAATEWGRSVFGAPRNFADLIGAVHVRDEVFDRVFTATVRREIREERIPTKGRTQMPRVDPNAVDPFAIGREELRAASEYVASCASCEGSCTQTCSRCRGSGRETCHNCSGSGKEYRRTKKSGHYVRCQVCHATGAVPCRGCDGSGNVTCPPCNGFGHQLAWLTYDEEPRNYIAIQPQSPIFAAHRQLVEARALAPADLQEFGTLACEETGGPLQAKQGMDSALLGAQTSPLDHRLERVRLQQYLKIAAVRRDAEYTMCGTTGVLVLSGGRLAGSRTPEALKPIRRRLILWVLSFFAVAFAASMVFGGLMGKAAYFERRNSLLVVAMALALVLGTLFAGGALRALRPRLRVAGVRRGEKIAGLGVAIAVLAGLMVTALTRPTISEAQRALGAGDVARAHLVVDALHETKGPTADVLDLDDAILLGEAQGKAGDAKLALLDQVAARGGARAKQANDAARAERITEIQQLVQDKHFDDATARMDKWWPSGTWKADAEIAELRASVEDTVFAACSDDPCRYGAAVLARGATSTPEREARTGSARQALLVDLTFSDVPGETLLSRLKRLGALGATATKTTAVAGDDKDLAASAGAAKIKATTERAKVALVGADESVAAELVGPLTPRDAGVETTTVDGVLVFLSLDPAKKCRGVYLVGPKEASRSLDGPAETTARLLSQAVGHAAVVKKPAQGSTTSRWMEGATGIVGRWADGVLVELRIGDATP